MFRELFKKEISMQIAITRLFLLFSFLLCGYSTWIYSASKKEELPVGSNQNLTSDTDWVAQYSSQLGKATGKGLAQTVTRFLKQKPQKKERSIPEKQHQDFIQSIFEGRKVAIPQRSIDIVRTVKLNKTPFNSSALMAGVVSGNLAIVEYLLENNANPDIQNKDGITALHLAARAGKKHIVKKLLIHGANPNIQDKHSMTPLMYAVTKNYHHDKYDLIKLLLHHDADPNLINYKGFTALMMAAENDDHDVVKLLLKYHANPAVKNSKGQMAIDLTHDKELQDLLVVGEFSFRPFTQETDEEMFPVFGGPTT